MTASKNTRREDSEVIAEEVTKPVTDSGLLSGGSLSALQHRNYRLFFGAQIFNLPGTWMQLVAEGWLVYQLTGSALALGLIRFLHTIPVTLLSVVAGGLADRYDKRRVLIITQSLCLVLAACLFFLTFTDRVELWHIGVLAFAVGVANAFDIPTRQSFIVELVGKRDLMNAIALNASAFNIARIVGPALAGFIIAGAGVEYCFLANTISYLFVIVGYSQLRLEQHQRSAPKERFGRRIWLALKHVLATPTLRVIFAMVATNSLFGMGYTTLMPMFAEDVWGVGPEGLGSLLAANGVGALIGAVTVATQSHSRRVDLLAKVGATGFAIAMMGFAFCPNVLAASVALVFGGWFMLLFSATSNTLVQRQITDDLRGRIMGLYTLCFIGLMPFGAFISGAAATWLGAPRTLVVGSAICVVGSLMLWRSGLRQVAETPVH